MRTQPVSTITILLATLSLGALTACGDDDTTTTATAAAIAATTPATDLPGAVIKYTGDFDSA